MKKHLMFICIQVVLFSGASYAVENCCGLYSPGNDFKCGPHEKDPSKNGNCTWYARYKRPEVGGICTGKAVLWFNQAKNGGLAVGQTPTEGSIAVYNSWMTIDGVFQNVGHVAHVESVNADGSFNVSEMGWNTWNCVHYGTYTTSSFGGLIGFIYPVGRYSDGIDGFHLDGSSRAFIDAFNRNYPKIGWPTNRSGGVYVHKWTGPYDTSYRVWIQDFQGDTNAAHFGTDGQSAIILNSFLQPTKAYLVKEGMWGYYKENNDPHDFGEPFTEEVTTNYADSPFNLAADPVKAGDQITVQKFMRVFDLGGLPAHNNTEKKTLVYNNTRGGSVFPFAVGTFSIGNDFCPAGEQAYVYVDGPLANDKPWPNSTKKVPTGDWYTKSGDYIFVRHINGQRSGALSVHISEGNHQFIQTIATPVNLTATAETANSVRLTFTLPAGLIGYNVRVYQNSQKVADLPATENTLINGLSPNVNYCFRVSAVDNVSGVESALSGEACATTPSAPPPSQSYTVNWAATCKGANPDSPYDPANRQTIFYNSNGLVYDWLDLGNVYGVHNIVWRWLNPHDENSAGIDFDATPNLSGGTFRTRSLLDVSTSREYGTWQVRVYIDNVLVAANTFTLAVVLAAPANLTVSPQNGPKVVLNWRASAKAASYRIYRDEAFLAETALLTYTDTAVQYATTYRYKVLASNAGYQSPFSETKTTSINSPGPPSPPTGLRVVTAP